MLHSIYDLTTFCRKTTGDVPAKLVGASTTVVGKKLYLFGGRLVSERRIVSDIYMFDMELFSWERIPAHPEDVIPRHRYFHSADAWNNHLVVFGGMTNQPDSPNPDELCVLNDIHFFDLATRRWVPMPSLPQNLETTIPRARYAHLSAISADRLFVIGGQDFYNTWLDDICVYDLRNKTWIQRHDYPRHCGTYRSVAVASNMTVRMPQDDIHALNASSMLGAPGTRFKSDNSGVLQDDFTASESLIHLPYSAPASDDYPSDIYLYSNYNFTDVKRELEVLSPLPGADFTIQDQSSTMAGTTFPPGLRFPTGAILGSNLIIAGTYLAHSYQSFSIWVLDLISMTWSRIDPGKALETGSWFRACLWPEANQFLIFGNRNGNLVDDYNRRLLSWDHVAVVDLEAFGIYQPPPLKLDLHMQEFGLAALEESVMADFELICDDGRRISCSRKLLDDRWPWFREQRLRLLQMAIFTSEALPPSSMHTPLPSVPGTASVFTVGSDAKRVALDPRLTPRAFHLSEPFPITLALLQYFYAQALITPLQHAPAVLSQLLVLSTVYGLSHLEALVRHAMHRMLNNATSVAVYEVATLCSCRSLQIRALKTVMSYTQKRPKSKSDRDSGTGGGGGSGIGGSGGDGGNLGGGGTGNESETQISRPRGTSDAKWRTIADSGNTSSREGFSLLGSQPVMAAKGSEFHQLKGVRSESFEHNHKRQNDVQPVSAHVGLEMSYYNTTRSAHLSAIAVPLSPRTVSLQASFPTHSRNGSASTISDSGDDRSQCAQTGLGVGGLRMRSRAQSVSSKLATVAEQENSPEAPQHENSRVGTINRPRAQSTTGQVLRQFPVPPPPMRKRTSLVQPNIAQNCSTDENEVTDSLHMRGVSQTGARTHFDQCSSTRLRPPAIKTADTGFMLNVNGINDKAAAINNPVVASSSTGSNTSTRYPVETSDGELLANSTYPSSQGSPYAFPQPLNRSISNLNLRGSTCTTPSHASTSSFSSQFTPSTLHTPNDSLSLSTSYLDIIDEQPFGSQTEQGLRNASAYGLSDALSGGVVNPELPMKIVPGQSSPRPRQKGIGRRLTLETQLANNDTSRMPKSPTLLTASASTLHTSPTPSPSSTPLSRLLSKVSLGKDATKNQPVTPIKTVAASLIDNVISCPPAEVS
ncbi:hypothetical protein AX17_005178 [Amanita inopinata Kibby_2008]|nr:hypothetical protein AX17_005178 [Amanita inopinata Kibby_2008]